MSDEALAKFGHHPDAEIDAYIEVERLQGALAEAHAGMIRALDFRTATPEGLRIKADVRHMLERTGFTGNLGYRESF